MRISDVIGSKPSKDVITIPPDATVRDLIRLLGEHNVGALIVSTDGSAVDGIVSERDVVRHLLDSDDILDGAVSAIMTVEVATAEPSTSLDEMRALMTERRIRHVPVVTDGSLSGHHLDRGRRQGGHGPAAVRARPARLLRAPDLVSCAAW